jgi:deoxyribodipyrimidine photo-lyase
MTTLIHWFRNDLRLSDNPALTHAARRAERVLPVYVHAPSAEAVTPWGFARRGEHRQRFLRAALDALHARLVEQGSGLLEIQGEPAECLPALAAQVGAAGVTCEAIAAPEEEAQLAALRAAGVQVEAVWQSSLLDPAGLPFEASRLPDVFTAFRQAVERVGLTPPPPLPVPRIPGWPAGLTPTPTEPADAFEVDARSSFPYTQPAFHGGEAAALAHLHTYFASDRPHRYKATRNGLTGVGFSSKFSPWLASGALSARTAYAHLKAFEAEQGASDGSYWLWFELLWRDYFRFLHLKYGRRLYRAGGLGRQPAPAHDPANLERWCRGETGEPLVDAAMRELAATGFMSNRLRQLVASYLIHDLGCDWRAGAAWFEAQLIDYDVYSNQGNWLYIAGRGTDPRGGRRFDPIKQAREHDPAGHYRRLWSHP